MSKAVNGVIQAINFRQINADGSPNQYQKTHYSSLQVDGEWYGSSQIKPSPRGQLELRVQKGKDWITLEVGDTVQFFTKSREKNGKTYHDVNNGIILVSKGPGGNAGGVVGQQAPARTAAGATPTTAGSPLVAGPAGNTAPGGRPVYDDNDPMQKRITDGMVFNNAVQVCIAHGDLQLQHIVVVSENVRKAYATYRASLGNAVQPKPAPAPAPAPTPVSPTPVAASVPVAPAPVAAPMPSPVAKAAPIAAPAYAPAPPAAQQGGEFEDDDIPF